MSPVYEYYILFQVDPKEHDEVVAENNKLQKSLAEEERAKAALENSKAELMRAKAAAEKQRDDVNAVKSRLTNQVWRCCFEV